MSEVLVGFFVTASMVQAFLMVMQLMPAGVIFIQEAGHSPQIGWEANYLPGVSFKAMRNSELCKRLIGMIANLDSKVLIPILDKVIIGHFYFPE